MPRSILTLSLALLTLPFSAALTATPASAQPAVRPLGDGTYRVPEALLADYVRAEREVEACTALEAAVRRQLASERDEREAADAALATCSTRVALLGMSLDQERELADERESALRRFAETLQNEVRRERRHSLARGILIGAGSAAAIGLGILVIAR